MLVISNTSYKITNSILEIISFINEIIKLLNYLDQSLLETVIYQFVKITKNYLTNCRETIIDGEGVIKGKMKSISQKHIILLNSNSIILTYILNHLSINIQKTFPSKQEIILTALKDLLNILNKTCQDCKEKIYDLFYQTYLHLLLILIIFRIEDSLNELTSLDFAKYPVLNKSEFNQYCIKFSMFKTLYNHMLNGFNNDEINEIFQNNFTIYFDKLEKLLVFSINNHKIEIDAGYKQ